MRVVLRGVAFLGAVLALGAAAAGATSAVRVTVKPLRVAPGARLTVTARVTPAGVRCAASVSRPDATAARLPARKAVGGRASWSWTVPVRATAGRGTARVTCAGAGKGSAAFTIVAPRSGDPVAGKTVFLQSCGGCHVLRDAGTNGVSGPDLDAFRPSYAKVVDRVTNGRGVMPSYRTRLTAREIADVAAYVSSVAGR